MRDNDKIETFTTTIGTGAEVCIVRTVRVPPPPKLAETPSASGSGDGDFDPTAFAGEYARAIGQTMLAVNADRTPRISWEITIKRPRVGREGKHEETITLAPDEASEVFEILSMLVRKGAAPVATSPWG